MEGILDSLKRIINKWTRTATLLDQNVIRGDTILKVKNAKRFSSGDEIALIVPSDSNRGEVDLHIDYIIDNTTIKLASPGIRNPWQVSQQVIVSKMLYGQMVQDIYIGDPDTIPRYPAISIYGSDKSSEWMTLNSTKERFEVEITTYVLDSTLERGYRFLMALTKVIESGLKKNIFPLVGDYSVTTLAPGSPASMSDMYLNIANGEIFEGKFGGGIILEDQFQYEELWVEQVTMDGTNAILKLRSPVCFNYTDEANVVLPTRFIFNSWASKASFGKIHKGDLLKASTISWFAEEEELQNMVKQDTKLF